MARILIVGGDTVGLANFSKALQHRNGNRVSWICSGREALSIISREKIDTVVVDEELPRESGFALVKEVITANPMVNCAMVSDLPAAEFHEAAEGLGVIIQLPPRPGTQHAERLLKLIESIDVLMSM